MTDRNPSQLAAVSLRDQALNVVRNALVTGDIQPGHIYSAASLATQLGVSSSPVREAMLTLVNEGLLEPVRNRGFRIVPLSQHDLNEIYEMRVLLEVASVEKIARVGIGDTERRLRDLVDAAEAKAAEGDVPGFLAVDRDFHLEVLGLLKNRRLVSIVSNLRDQTRLYGLRPLARPGQLSVSASEHRALLDAISGQDIAAAADVMLRHLEHVRSDGPGSEHHPDHNAT